jgi:hypothetical protein
MATAQMRLVSNYTVIWQQCWTPQICINIPFDSKKCIGATVCVGIIEDGGTFYIEGSINGATARYALADACIPVYTIGIASLEICVTNLNISKGNLNSLTLSVKACIGGSIAGINLQQCWDLYNQTIKFHTFASQDVINIVGLDVEREGLAAPEWSGRKFVTHGTPVLVTQTDKCSCEGA